MEAKNDKEKFRITKEAVNYFTKNYDCVTIDGVRVKFNDGWGLVRASNTQPVIVCRFEASTPERKIEIQNLIMNKLKEFGQLELENH
jgi:phosphomannomutase/phosphoglucomutase